MNRQIWRVRRARTRFLGSAVMRTRVRTSANVTQWHVRKCHAMSRNVTRTSAVRRARWRGRRLLLRDCSLIAAIDAIDDDALRATNATDSWLGTPPCQGGDLYRGSLVGVCRRRSAVDTVWASPAQPGGMSSILCPAPIRVNRIEGDPWRINCSLLLKVVTDG